MGGKKRGKEKKRRKEGERRKHNDPVLGGTGFIYICLERGGGGKKHSGEMGRGPHPLSPSSPSKGGSSNSFSLDDGVGERRKSAQEGRGGKKTTGAVPFSCEERKKKKKEKKKKKNPLRRGEERKGKKKKEKDES